MGWKREQIGACLLYRGDCREILPTLGPLDAVVTDPPWGIQYNPQRHIRYDGSPNVYTQMANDETPMDLAFLFAGSWQKIIWGAPCFFAQLPHRGRWLCWHKRSWHMPPNSMRGSDFELAWIDRSTGFDEFFHCVHGGVVNADSLVGNNEPRVHPTQKPIALMRWCVEKTLGIVLDPFMGSGTTALACIQLSRTFIGIEIEEKYFSIACKRIEEATRQGALFLPQVSQAPQQLALVGV